MTELGGTPSTPSEIYAMTLARRASDPWFKGEKTARAASGFGLAAVVIGLVARWYIVSEAKLRECNSQPRNGQKN